MTLKPYIPHISKQTQDPPLEPC